MSYVVVRLLGR